MSNVPHIRLHFHKYLLLTDGTASSSRIIQSVRETLLQHKKAVEFHDVGLTDAATFKNEVLSLFSRQTMGTFLYIAGSSQTVESLQRLAMDAGFTEEEMEVTRFGEVEKRLFCAGCQAVFGVPPHPQVVCQNCGLLLTVTNHFSPRLSAYLGSHEIK